MKENIGSFQRRPIEPLFVLDREGVIVVCFWVKSTEEHLGQRHREYLPQNGCIHY